MKLSRRMFLGGAGTLVALPALEIFERRMARAEPASPPQRLVVYFVPNGRVTATWVPPESGPSFSFPQALAPLAPLQADMICLSGLLHTAAVMSTGTGDHARGTGTILNCAPYPDGGLHGDISMDQTLVKALEPDTRFASLQWGAGEPGACDFAASCVYTQSISWAGPKAPLAPMIDPLTAFNQLFAGANEGATAEEQARRRASLQSVLDYVLADAEKLQQNLGSDDRHKLDEYFTSVRELEKRLAGPGSTCDPGPAPAPGLDYPSRVRAFNDLIVIALQCDQTRVISFMIENGLSNRSHPFIGAAGGHHALTHGGATTAGQLLALETWQAEQASYLAQKLKSVQDIDGTSLLDNTAVLILPDMGDGGPHDHEHLAPVIVGKCKNTLSVGQSIHCAGAPLGNLFVALLQAFGVMTNTFGVDGTAPLPGLLAQ